MQFMIGTYCELESCVTEMTTIRGFGLRVAVAADEAEKASVVERRLMSAAEWSAMTCAGRGDSYARQRAIDKAPTRFEPVSRAEVLVNPTRLEAKRDENAPPSGSSGTFAIISLTPILRCSSTIRNCWYVLLSFAGVEVDDVEEEEVVAVSCDEKSWRLCNTTASKDQSPRNTRPHRPMR